MSLIRDLHPVEEYEPVSLWTLYPDANPQRPTVQPAPLEDNSALTRDVKLAAVATARRAYLRRHVGRRA